ncbi:Deoxyribodipyrimidine photo-lyase [Limnospira maxima CS-328]|uniref:Deoxyribodipyrimidine photo-lyase n=1 Tax=Limnospira maxima CS-328 TaxID=513049 RepID=B5W1N5_LIMMA|nr:FAD-binding domain-containing protein [Limnospira maxima]EDZ94483.1 Deoxyribodipyrimidine photo-lyase [Limnospira maxima CS-328]MDC0838211.1 deoxyribodipyrimidine photo-lyase [Limnoraphis robusta]
MSDLILFWHRRDLRISDNWGLAAARRVTSQVVGVFCLDPAILSGDDIAPVRVAYMIGCLQCLQRDYQRGGSQLLIIQDNPAQGLRKLAVALGAIAVYWNQDVEPLPRQRDRSVEESLTEVGIKVETFWDQVLHSPEAIFTGSKEPYKVYTPYWRKWIQQPKPEPCDTLKSRGLTEAQEKAAREAGAIALPTAKDLGFIWSEPFILEPGETAASDRLQLFCDRAIYEYDQGRNFPAIDGTSLLSPALRFGAIGIRTLWQKTQEIMALTRSDEARDHIQTWQQEIAWREFYQQALYHFPALATGAFRQPFDRFPWSDNQEHFQAWCQGRTGYPIVDAAMRQLNETGWMHNRCRMIVASFLTKDLIINWQWGEKYFMQRLIDGDLASNNGGWQWSSSSGMDPKPLRIFNPASQAQKYDPEAEYIRQWLPELRNLETAHLVTGKISSSDRQACGYPQPIVDHNQQQKLFKSIYSQLKA